MSIDIKIKYVCSHIKEINSKLKGEEEEDNESNMVYDNYVDERINSTKKQIEDLKLKLKYNFFLMQGEELISIIFKEAKYNIHFSVFCKNTDKFILAYNKLRKKFKILNENEYNLYCDNKQIDLNKNFIENRIKNGDIINLKQREN